MSRHPRNDEVLHAIFHRLWSENAGAPGYDKASWRALEDQAFGSVGYTCEAFDLVAGLRRLASARASYAADHWDELERQIFGATLREKQG